MKKAFVAFVLLGAGFGTCYTQGIFDGLLGGKDVAEGNTPSPVVNTTNDPFTLFNNGNFGLASSLLQFRASCGDLLEVEESVLLARCHGELGETGREKEAWTQVLRNHASSPEAGEALLGLARIAQRENRPEEAASYCKEALEKHPDSDAAKVASKTLGEYCLSNGDKAGARRAFSASMAMATPKEKERYKKILTELNGEMLNDGFDTDAITIYSVRPGDSLARIARRHRTTVGLIKRINRLDGDLIHPGQDLKIVTGEVRLEVRKSTFSLAVYVNDVWTKEYIIGIGKNDKTPEGDFVIANRIENPPWFWKGEVIPAGDERNILGTRWMGFKNKPGLTGFGIHGTTQPESVPGAVSMGCIRMRNRDVEDLFDLVPMGTRVVIRN